MRALTRALAALVVGASSLVLVVSPAPAQEGGPVLPRAEAQATALRLSLFGNELVLSGADTAADAAPGAAAHGTGALLATTGFGQSSATADAANPSAGSEDPTCSDLSLPDGIPLPVGVITACSAAQASVSEGAGSAAAQGLAADISVLSTEDSPLPIDEVTGTVLAPILDLLGQAPLPEQLDQLTTVLQLALEGDITVLAIEAGATDATSTASSGAASATATAEGATITILDRSILGPVATIVIGRSVATATYEGDDISAEHVTAPVTIQFGVDVATILGAPTAPIPVPPGQSIDLPLPAPLTSRVIVAGGEDTETATLARSLAANIRVELATGLPGGGVVLAVSDAAAAVERPPAEDTTVTTPQARPPAARPQPAAPVATPRQALPRTGGDGSWLAVSVLLGVGAGLSALGYRRLRSTRPA